MFVQAINELTSASYTTTLKDETGAVIPAASLTALTLSLYEANGGATVNSRSNQNVLNANNVTVDSNGLLTWAIQPADTAIIDGTKAVEPHIAVFRATWASGAKSCVHQFELDVTNIQTVP